MVAFSIKTAFLYTGFAFLAVVAYKMLLATLETSGLLSTDPEGSPEPERVQMIAGTVAAAVAYGSHCLAAFGAGSTQMVEPEGWIIAMAGGSQLFYLVGKSIRS